MKKMTSMEIRKSWIEFFESKKHLFLEPVSLIPNNDPSLLWINSGVATLKKYFSGEENPPAPRLVNCQKAIRTNDIFNVGKTARHQTLFEMVGNFSIGDYQKKEAITFAFELLIKKWEIDLNKLWFTVFEDDQIAFNTWVELGVNPNRIIKCGRDRNFWDVGNGPCGPCTEIHYDRGEKFDFQNLGEKLIKEDIENDRYIEIWNIVFSEFNNDGNGNYKELFRKNIDTGAGLERLASISQEANTNFDTDLFLPIIGEIEKFSNQKYDIDNYFKKDSSQEKINFNYRVIADHLRAAVFAISDGCLPANKERGYVLRRLIRRMMICVEKLGINTNNFIEPGVNAIINIMNDFYPSLKQNKEMILEVLNNEYNAFKKTLNNGIKYFNEAITKINNKILDPKTAFELVTTYGFPIELVIELCEEKEISLDINKFETLMKEHQEISKSTRNITGMKEQKESLLKLNVESKFNYNITKTNANVIALFNDKFEPVYKLENEPGYAIFNITPFYATSGGQIHDNGYVKVGILGKKQEITDVIKGPNSQHLHYSDNFNIKKLNQKVKLVINTHDRNILKAQHTSEHLLHSALKNVISKDIKQEGAFKSTEKITFDFKYHEKLTNEQLKALQKWVNDQIKKSIEVKTMFVTLEEAKAMKASAYFEDVYKKLSTPLRLIKIGDISVELCGGTHVENTANIEDFKIVDFYSKGSGSWRIEAISTKELIKNYEIQKYDAFFNEINLIKVNMINLDCFNAQAKAYLQAFDNIYSSLDFFEMDEKFKELTNALNNIKKEKQLEIQKEVVNVIKQVVSKNDANKKLFICSESISFDAIKEAIDQLINEEPNNIFWFIKQNKSGWQFFICANEKFVKEQNINLNDLVKSIKNQLPNTKGGGKPHYIQGGINDTIFEEDLTILIKDLGFKKCV